MSNLLKLHVLMPTFNRADLLDQTLRQVLNQDCDESLWKLTVIDNASTDKTKEILKKYSNLNNNFERIDSISTRKAPEPTAGSRI